MGEPHSALVRITHWIHAACFLALLVSGAEIVASHPRFYWGENGNVNTPALFQIPIPSSRATVPTGYGYVLHDQNGWSRYLHFQSAWIVVPAGLIYAITGIRRRHFRKSSSYTPLQRSAYLTVVFLLTPLVIWTGLAMSPAFTSILPATVTLLGGRQSARTIHFFTASALAVFLLGHVAMVYRAGFLARVKAMTIGSGIGSMEEAS